MLLHLSTWPEIEAWLARSKTVVIPIGSNEQHGPTGLLGTDWLCPEIIAHEAHKGGGDILVGPTFNIGMAQHHLGFPGTISLRPSTFIAAISDWVRSLAGHGSHATPSEIAITQWAYPQAIKSANYAPRIASSGPIREALDFRARHPDGRMGSDPSLATPERGEALVRAAVAGLLREVGEFSREQAPT